MEAHEGLAWHGECVGSLAGTVRVTDREGVLQQSMDIHSAVLGGQSVRSRWITQQACQSGKSITRRLQNRMFERVLSKGYVLVDDRRNSTMSSKLLSILQNHLVGNPTFVVFLVIRTLSARLTTIPGLHDLSQPHQHAGLYLPPRET